MKHTTRIPLLLTLTMVLCLAFCVPALAAAEPEAAAIGFTDISDSPYADEIQSMCDEGYAAGYTDGTFRPDRPFTRVEMAQLLCSVLDLDLPETPASAFTDCGVAGAGAIEAVVSAGYMTGVDETTFDPYGEVLRPELLYLLNLSAAALGVDDFPGQLDEATAAWKLDYTVATAGDCLHAAYALLHMTPVEAPAASGEPSGEPSAEPAEAVTEPDAGEPAVEEPAVEEPAAEEIPAEEPPEEAPAEEPAAEETPAEEPMEEPPAEEPAETPAPESAVDAASAEPAGASAEAAASEEPAANEASSEPAQAATTPPQGVVAAQPSAAPVAAATPAAPAAPAATPAPVEPDAGADDPGAAFKAQVSEVYHSIRTALVNLLSGLLA